MLIIVIIIIIIIIIITIIIIIIIIIIIAVAVAAPGRLAALAWGQQPAVPRGRLALRYILDEETIRLARD